MKGERHWPSVPLQQSEYDQIQDFISCEEEKRFAKSDEDLERIEEQQEHILSSVKSQLGKMILEAEILRRRRQKDDSE